MKESQSYSCSLCRLHHVAAPFPRNLGLDRPQRRHLRCCHSITIPVQPCYITNIVVAPQIGATLYTAHSKLERNYEEAEARSDEVEGSLRGHIGLIEESLERIESSAKGVTIEGGWGKGMGKKAEELYGKRGRDEKHQ